MMHMALSPEHGAGVGVAVGDTTEFTGLHGQHQDELPADHIDDLAQLCQLPLLGTVT